MKISQAQENDVFGPRVKTLMIVRKQHRIQVTGAWRSRQAGYSIHHANNALNEKLNAKRMPLPLHA
jgi:hypothetical protein